MRAMNLFDVPPADVRPMLVEERMDLLRLLRALAPAEWALSSAAPGWSVKDLALHLLDDDLGWLSRGRDGDRTGLLSTCDHGSFVEALAAKNQRWIDGAAGLSMPVIIGLLEWAGGAMDVYYSTMDLEGDGQVSWASDGRVPMWFDIAQDLTERWVHQMQMREAGVGTSPAISPHTGRSTRASPTSRTRTQTSPTMPAGAG
jgi:Mycothiol maleylpyruvate isomerase N-terminal domain.